MRLELKKIQAENAALAQKVQAGRESLAQTEHRISTTVDEWKVREKQQAKETLELYRIRTFTQKNKHIQHVYFYTHKGDACESNA